MSDFASCEMDAMIDGSGFYILRFTLEGDECAFLKMRSTRQCH